MILQLELGAEIEARLIRAAKEHELDPTEYARQLFEQSLPKEAAGTGRLTPGEFDQFLKEMAEGSDNLPVLPDEAFSRESIYREDP